MDQEMLCSPSIEYLPPGSVLLLPEVSPARCSRTSSSWWSPDFFLETDFGVYQRGLFPLRGGHRLTCEIGGASGQPSFPSGSLECSSFHKPSLRLRRICQGTSFHSTYYEHVLPISGSDQKDLCDAACSALDNAVSRVSRS